MSRHEDRVRLQHMLDFAREAVSFCRGRTRADLSSNLMLSLALTRLIEVIGEAATRVSNETRTKTPNIPWPDIIAARNRLIHGYPTIDLDIIWDIVTKDLPALIAELEKALGAAEK